MLKYSLVATNSRYTYPLTEVLLSETQNLDHLIGEMRSSWVSSSDRRADRWLVEVDPIHWTT